MGEPNEEPARRSSVVRLGPLRDIIVAPARAYAEVLAAPSWLPAFAVVLACGLFDLWLTTPAILHVMARGASSRSLLTSLAAPTARKNLFLNGAAFQVLEPLVAWSLTAIVASTGARLRRMTIPYRAFFALAAVCSIPSALGAIVDGVFVAVRSPASYTSLKALAVAVPDNLAIFASPGNAREVVFLSSFGLFDLWSTILLAYGLIAFAQFRLEVALIIAFGMDIAIALLFGP